MSGIAEPACGTLEVIFHQAKAGSPDADWEDGAGYAHSVGCVRCVVVDGATEAYDAVRWASQLVDGFLGLDGIRPLRDVTINSMVDWLAAMQKLWAERSPMTFDSVFEERKFAEQGSLATFLGCELSGLAGPRPHWSALALGDTLLFHIRSGRLITTFPDLRAEDFGLNPIGAFTRPTESRRMLANLRRATGSVIPGDVLYLATDACAEWIVRSNAGDATSLWRRLAELENPAEFGDLIGEQRRLGLMKNDDVTLLRLIVTTAETEMLVIAS